MKLKKIKATEVNQIVKATVHKSGKLGFSKGASEYMELDQYEGVEILMNDDDSNDQNLYVKTVYSPDEDEFDISKAGEYYYVNLKSFYDQRGEDYKNESIVYRIAKMEIDGEEYFVFKREIKPKKGTWKITTEENKKEPPVEDS